MFLLLEVILLKTLLDIKYKFIRDEDESKVTHAYIDYRMEN